MMCSSIEDYGMQLINKIKAEKGITDRPFNILTHCNAGWLATVDWGTALSPIYNHIEMESIYTYGLMRQDLVIKG